MISLRLGNEKSRSFSKSQVEAAAKPGQSSIICSGLSVNQPHCKPCSLPWKVETDNCLSTVLTSGSLKVLEGLFQVLASPQLFVVVVVVIVCPPGLQDWRFLTQPCNLSMFSGPKNSSVSCDRSFYSR